MDGVVDEVERVRDAGRCRAPRASPGSSPAAPWRRCRTRRGTPRRAPCRGCGAVSRRCRGRARRRGSTPPRRLDLGTPGRPTPPARHSCRTRLPRRRRPGPPDHSPAWASSASASPTMFVGVIVAIRSCRACMSSSLEVNSRYGPAAVVEVREHHVVAGGRQPRRHVAQRRADARGVHQIEHDRMGPVVLGVEQERRHRSIRRGEVDLSLDHRPILLDLGKFRVRAWNESSPEGAMTRIFPRCGGAGGSDGEGAVDDHHDADHRANRRRQQAPLSVGE